MPAASSSRSSGCTTAPPMTAPGSAWPSSRPSPRSTAAPSPPAPAMTAACPSRSRSPRPAPRPRAPAFWPPNYPVFRAQADVSRGDWVIARAEGPLSASEVGQDGEYPAVLGVVGRQAELGEDVADVFFHRAGGDH